MSNISQVARPKPKPGVMDIHAYVPGRAEASGASRTYKLSSNENPLGAPAAAVEAAMRAASHLQLYPDGSAHDLREAIGEIHGLNPAEIVCGNGSDELLALLASAYLLPGDEGIYCEHGFLEYRIQIQAAGGTPVVVKERDLTADVDAILAAVTERTKVVFLANPNNPTGSYVPFESVRRLQAGLPPSALLVLDAAYAEYVRRDDYHDGADLVSSSNNVVMTRTFSKIFGLAGLRIGWMYAPSHVTEVINRIRGPFNINAPALAAAAAAIRDRAHVERSAAHNETWLAWLTKALAELGLTVTPSVGNFILIHFPDDKVRSAVEADRFLLERGLILRGVAGYGFPNALRMTVGTEQANRAVVTALAEFLGR